jgi:hypothetical protein
MVIHHFPVSSRRKTMKHLLLFVVLFALAASPLPARDENRVETLSYRISGTVVLLGNPLGPDGFSALPTYGGKGPLGGITGQAFYVYETIGSEGQMTCIAGQAGLRFEATGDTLLLLLTPGLTGTMMLGSDGSMNWTQTWMGLVAGGTGRFAGRTGTFTKTLAGHGVMPGFVSTWEGTMEIVLN